MADTENDTSLVLTGVYSGLSVSAKASSGTFATSTTADARTGYKIAEMQDSEGHPYTLVTLIAEKGVTDVPSFVATADYAQESEIPEVDLDLRYTDVPQGTQVELFATESVFQISRQQISGTGLVGSSGKNLGAFTMALELRLWLPSGSALRPTSAITISISKIQAGVGKPVKKVLLQKLATNLSN